MKQAVRRAVGFPLPLWLLPVHAAGVAISGSSSRGEVALRGAAFGYANHGQEWTSGQCGSRERQSPVDFSRHAPWGCAATELPSSSPAACNAGSVWLTYDKVEKSLRLFSGSAGTVGVDVSGRGVGGVTLHKQWFDIHAVQFRAQSEHTFEGQHLPLEVQLVHKNPEFGHLLGVALLFDPDAPEGNTPEPVVAALQGLVAGLPKTSTAGSSAAPTVTSVTLTEPMDLLAPLVFNATFFEYAGSLTTPPCTELMTWLVRRERLYAPLDVVQHVREAVLANNADAENWRSTMPAMGRTVSVLMGRPGLPPPDPDAPVQGEFAPHPLATLGSPFGGIVVANDALAHAVSAATAADLAGDSIVQSSSGFGSFRQTNSSPFAA